MEVSNFEKGKLNMEIKQVINGGKLKGSYLSSWSNELQLTVEGGHEFSVKIPEEELRDLANRINERLDTIDAEKQDKLEDQVRAEIEAQEEELSDLNDGETNG